MAMTGGTAYLVKSETPSGWSGQVNLYVYYKISQDKNNNKSTIYCGMYVTTPSGWSIGSWTDFKGSYVGSTSNTFDGTIPNFSGTRWLVENKQITVTHADNGTASATIYWRWGVNSYSDYKYQNYPSGSFTITLPTIPRASTVDSVSCNTSYLDGTMTYKYTPQSANYYNRCTISLNVNGTHTTIKTINIGKKSTSQQTATVTLSDSELSTIYNKLPSTTKGTLRFTFQTYSDSGYSTQVGSSYYKEISLTIPADVKPTVGTITLDPVNITTKDETSRDILVKGKNKLTISVADSEAGTGSSIKSYTFSGQNVSVTQTSSSMTSSGVINPTIKNAASVTLTYKVTVTDTRGRSNSASQSITCYDYIIPSFSSFKTYRANSSGTAVNNGTYIKCDYIVKYSSVNNTNKIYSFNVYGTNGTVTYSSGTTSISNDGIVTAPGSALINLGSDTASTFDIYATFIDNYGSSKNSSTETTYGETRILNITKDGTGIAIGKMAQESEMFECRWPAKINGGLTIGTSTQSSAPTDGITIHDVRDVELTPNSFGDKNANFYFNKISNEWSSVLHMKGWTGNYAAWELAGNAHSTSNDNTLKYRQGLGDTWGDWQTVLTNKNIDNYVDKGAYLPLDGSKALTGKLTLGTNLYYTSGNYGLDCKNSDIIGANGIYFGDASDSAGEAICFYRGDGYWDTIYATDGVLKFHPNRATSTALGGYTIYNSSNVRRGTCTLSSDSNTSVSFSSALGGTPTVLLTPLTDVIGVIPGKVVTASSTGFTATIGGTAVSSAKFAYLAIYY